MPLALQDPGELYRYVHLEDEGIAYVQLRLNTASGGRSIREFTADARRRIEEDQPRAIVLDNRFNPGGDLTRTVDFAQALPSLVPEDGMVYVMTSNATFSAGIYRSSFPKAVDAQKTLVIGERKRFWAESDSTFTLPQGVRGPRGQSRLWSRVLYSGSHDSRRDGWAWVLGGLFAHSSCIAAVSFIRERLHRRVTTA